MNPVLCVATTTEARSRDGSIATPLQCDKAALGPKADLAGPICWFGSEMMLRASGSPEGPTYELPKEDRPVKEGLSGRLLEDRE